MSENSPHFLFDPDSRGSLFYKFDKGLPIIKSDVDRVLNCDQEAHQDPRMPGILIASHRGELIGKLGRPRQKYSFTYRGQIFSLTEEVENRAAEIREVRKGLSAIETRALRAPK